jgi:hypothetical protein
LDIVVVPVLVVVVSSGSVVAPGEPGDGVSGGNSVAVELPVGVNIDVVVLTRRTPEDVVVVVDDDDVNDVPAGAVECREVCRTANTMRTTASTPATPAATTTGVCSYH